MSEWDAPAAGVGSGGRYEARENCKAIGISLRSRDRAEFCDHPLHAGIKNIVRGVTKNFFAGSRIQDFRVFVADWQPSLPHCSARQHLPFLALPFVHGWTLAACSAEHHDCAWVSFGNCFCARVMRASPLYAFTHPIGAAIFSYMLLRSTVVTLVQGGIIWRGTFYPLDELRRGIV